MIAIILGVALVILGIIALIKDVLDLYVAVGVGFILVGAWILVGARDWSVRP